MNISLYIYTKYLWFIWTVIHGISSVSGKPCNILYYSPCTFVYPPSMLSPTPKKSNTIHRPVPSPRHCNALRVYIYIVYAATAGAHGRFSHASPAPTFCTYKEPTRCARCPHSQTQIYKVKRLAVYVPVAPSHPPPPNLPAGARA